MSEAICEYVDSRGVALRVDRAGGVLRGVKLIGLESLNGRRYRPEALARAVGLYEGAKVNVNHPKEGPLAPRDYRDRLGVIRQVEFRPAEGLFGNLHFNPKHAIAEQLAWDAANNPRNVGFSHNVLARLAHGNDGAVVEEITHVQSVDLVADPAATQGLFEGCGEACAARRCTEGGAGEGEAPAEPAPDSVAARREPRPPEDEPPSRAVEEAEERARLAERRAAALEQLARHGFFASAGHRSPREAIGAAFYDALLAAADEACMEALIVEQAEALRAAREGTGVASADSGAPRSTEQQTTLARSGGRCGSTEEFVQAVRGRVCT